MKRQLRNCTSAREAVAAALYRGELEDLDEDVYHHLATCSRCRAALLVLVRSLEERAELPPLCSCAACQDELAVFIDAEQVNPVRAAQLYPHVWWHLLACSHCAATYEAVHLLFEVEHTGHISPLHETLREATRQRQW